VSWHGQKWFEQALAYLGACRVRRGINFCLSKFYEKDLELVKLIAKKQEAEILFLTYKPVNNDPNNQLSPARVLKIAQQTSKEGIEVAVDGMTCQTCLASKRFCDIDSLGNVMVCSFIRQPIGNLIKENFKTIWAKRNRVIICPYLV